VCIYLPYRERRWERPLTAEGAVSVEDIDDRLSDWSHKIATAS